MATVTLTRDDLNPEVTDDVKTVFVGYKGRTVEIDLGEANRERLETFISPFLDAGRPATVGLTKKTPATRKTRTRKPITVTATAPTETAPVTEAPQAPAPTAITSAVNGTTKLPTRPKLSRSQAAKENEAIREWAQGVGIELNPQGRIPNNVKEAYYADLSESSTAGEVTAISA